MVDLESRQETSCSEIDKERNMRSSAMSCLCTSMAGKGLKFTLNHVFIAGKEEVGTM